MATRIRRTARTHRPDFAEVERLMKSISQSQVLAAEHTALVKSETVELYDEMKKQGLSSHEVDGIIAELFRPKGRASNVVDPAGFRKLVKNDKEFYSAISVSVTEARKILPEKQLATITENIPGKLGEETVKVSFRGS